MKITKTYRACLFIITLCCSLSIYAQKNHSQLIGFEDIVKDVNNQRFTRLHKLEGKSYQLNYSKSGNFNLIMHPEGLFEIHKLSGNSFEVKLVNTSLMWQQNKKRPFKLKWSIVEIIDY